MSFNLANRLNNLAATTSTISIEVAENYYTTSQTDTEIANLKNKRVVIKNDNDANDPFLSMTRQTLVYLQSVKLLIWVQEEQYREAVLLQQDQQD